MYVYILFMYLLIIKSIRGNIFFCLLITVFPPHPLRKAWSIVNAHKLAAAWIS